MSLQTASGTGGMPCPMLKPLSLLETRYVRVDRQVCIIGAHPRVHLPLHSSMVSRAHALIMNDGAGEAYIRDLASRNGVYVNGHAVREGRLRDGDLICVGPYAFWWSAKMPGPRPRDLSRTEGNALLAVRGERAPRAIADRTFVIGARDGCDLQLGQDMVDHAHAVLYRHNDAFHLRDLNSRTGTFVNGRRVRNIELRQGDEIRVGLMLARFEPPDASAMDSDDASIPHADLPGLAGADTADRPLDAGELGARSCPTIEQLLGAPPTRITLWERRRM